MQYRLRTLLILLIVAGLLIASSLAVASPWLRRIHSLSVEGGNIVVETSPSGRLADPYRDSFGLSIPTAIVAAGFVLVVFIPLVLLISVPIIAAHDDSRKQ
jgi:hypothetical protein